MDCTFLWLIQLYHAIKISISKTCNFPCHSRVLFVTLLPVFPPVILLGCSKTSCLHTAVNEWHSGMPLMPAAIRRAFLIMIFFILKVSK